MSLIARPGRVQAVVGENGAGKSTLMKILSGADTEYDGELLLDGRRVRFDGPREAEARGIAIIYQELNLVPALTVAENIFLGREPSRLGFVDYQRLNRQATELLARLGRHIDPCAPVASLKVGDRQVVEIAKALSLDARVLIMDEPTSALGAEDVARLFEIIRALKRDRVAVIYISHKMDELFQIADEFTVLRDGRLVGHKPAGETNAGELIRMMVGRELAEFAPPSRGHAGDELLRVERLSSVEGATGERRRLHDISFTVRRGEILGIGGLMGSGRTELLESLFGVYPVAPATRITLDGREVRIPNPQAAIRRGIAFVTEDRKAQGLIFDLSVGENITLPRLADFSRRLFINRAAEARAATEYVGRLNIKTPSLATQVENLSGGNQQKAVVAKWLLTRPRLLLLDDPTRGIDVGAKAEIYRLIESLAGGGMTMIIVSSELAELLLLSERILVMREGTVAGTLNRSEATEERIIELAATRSASAIT